tara:strand:- start:3783 stop:4334 length:552 start_codon:yes stop_codon:yes gene_type:complete
MVKLTTPCNFRRNEIIGFFRALSVSVTFIVCSMAPLISQVFNLDEESRQVNNIYGEINLGVADTPFGWWNVSPGVSVLMVHRKQNKDCKLFLEYGYGLALPTIITGKVGFGVYGKSNTNLSAGVRVFPSHGYLRLGIPLKTKQGMAELGFSIEKSGREINPTFRALSFGSDRMLTVGLCMDIL